MLNIENSAKLRVISSNFTNTSGVNDDHEAIISVEGMGMIINNSTFYGTENYCVDAKNLWFPSRISNSTFNFNGSQSNALIGINDLSNTEIKITSCDFNGLYAGVVKGDGDLTLKCNTFNNTISYDVAGAYGCLVNASTNDYGGYNYFNSTGTGNIFLFSSAINILNGRNYFNNASSSHIFGSLNYPCGINTDCALNAARNQWATGLQPPAANKFSVVGSDGLPFMVSANLTEAIPSCGFYDNVGPITGLPQVSGYGQAQGNGVGQWMNGNGTMAGINNGQESANGGNGVAFSDLPFISTSFNSNIRLDHAVAYGRQNMVYNDTLGDDETAIDIFDDIFNNEVPKNNRHVIDWLNGSLSDMKTSIENAVFDQQISAQSNWGNFGFYLEKYVNALNYMTDSLIDDRNYTEAFYLELDKAHLFRILQLPEVGFEILDEIDYCGIDRAEQEILNYWKQEYEKDIVISQIGMAYLDSIIVIDTSAYTTPVDYTPVRYFFGARIIDPNEIYYPGCNVGDSTRTKSLVTEKEENIESNVYPNPSNDFVHFEFRSDKNFRGTGELVIYAVDGKRMNALLSHNNDNRSTIELTQNVGTWESGLYMFELRDETGILKTGSFVVE